MTHFELGEIESWALYPMKVATTKGATNGDQGVRTPQYFDYLQLWTEFLLTPIVDRFLLTPIVDRFLLTPIVDRAHVRLIIIKCFLSFHWTVDYFKIFVSPMHLIERFEVRNSSLKKLHWLPIFSSKLKTHLFKIAFPP